MKKTREKKKLERHFVVRDTGFMKDRTAEAGTDGWSGWPMPGIRDQQWSRLVGKTLALILLAICWSMLWVMQPSAQQADQDSRSASDASWTEQQWRQHVEDARARSAEFVARAKAGTAEIEPSNEEEKLADQRAMNDPSLRAGDIISTSRGFLVFQGLEDGGQGGRDFRSATDAEIATLHLSTPKH